MRSVTRHPDGFIYIRDGLVTRYAATLDEFVEDYGAAAPALPSGYVMGQITAQDRDAPIVVFTDAYGNATADLAWPAGEAVMADSDNLIAKRPA